MIIFFITFILIAIALAGMAIGVIAGRDAIKGSCGGLNRVGIDNSDCACSKKEQKACHALKGKNKG